jgi:hypothetical protein
VWIGTSVDLSRLLSSLCPDYPFLLLLLLLNYPNSRNTHASIKSLCVLYLPYFSYHNICLLSPTGNTWTSLSAALLRLDPIGYTTAFRYHAIGKRGRGKGRAGGDKRKVGRREKGERESVEEGEGGELTLFLPFGTCCTASLH